MTPLFHHRPAPLKTWLLSWALLAGSICLGLPADIPPASVSPLPVSSTRNSRVLLPNITSIRQEKDQIVVSASIPAGLKKATLESRPAIGSGTWIPRAVVRLDSAGGPVTFKLPRSLPLEVLRVRADAEEALPSSFYTGTNQFHGEATVENALPGSVYRTFEDTATQSPTEEQREVVESDLYQIRGDTLYFFNYHRGLQILDISEPAAPRLQGSLDLPAAGEQMYLLGDSHVVLLVRGGCYFNGHDESQVLIVATDSGSPVVRATLPVPGQIRESRLVGQVLYVASQSYRPMPGTDNSVWEWGLAVSSFDLALPETPSARDTLWYSGYGHVVSANDRFFFVAAQNPSDWRRSVIHAIDISDPTGSMEALPSLALEGRVTDKFKLNMSGDVLTIISQVQTTNLFTRLQTFSLADTARPAPLGELDLGLSERLHATRFAGDLVYVVTFFVPFRMDPLWVVDLSDPANPSISGELEVPGFSTFLQPRGNQLIALGIETNQTTVSLFDVANPADPNLLSRVPVGEGWSWSEASNNEKAFSILESEGLLLLPYQSWTPDGYVRRVQLIDLNDSSLTLRGAIDHDFSPRRATVHRDHILTLSGQELLSVEFTDRDHPNLVARTELAWPVDRTVLHGDFLIELANGSLYGWNESTPPTLRSTPANNPGTILEELELDALPITGITRQGSYLYVLQTQADPYPIWILETDPAQEGPAEEAPAEKPNFILTVLDLNTLPSLEPLSQTEHALDSLGSGTWQGIWPNPQTLVWSGGGMQSWWGWGGPVPLDALRVDSIRPWGFGGGGQLIAFDTSNPTEPALASELNLSTNNWWNFSSAYTANGLVHQSHQTTTFVEDLVVEGFSITNEAARGTWVTRYYLNVVDYANPSAPALRPPVNVPGQLKGLDRNGSILHTVGYHYDTTQGLTDWTEYLDASAYDGVSAHLIDSLPLTQAWPHPVLVTGSAIVIGQPGYDVASGETHDHLLTVWTLPDSGRYTPQSQILLENPASHLKSLGKLLAVQESSNNLRLFDLEFPAALQELGQARPQGCLWYNLENADGSLDRGLWLPLGSYGVLKVPVTE